MPVRIFDLHAPTPLLLRDGKPFSAAEGSETAARSLPVPLPSTLAGLVRTQIGAASGWDWRDYPTLQNAHGIPVAGLLARDGAIVLPAPRDAVVYRDKGSSDLKIMTLKPFTPPEGAGCDLPQGLEPLEVTEDVKPETGYNFWTQDYMKQWLLGKMPSALEKIEGLPLETRIHVGIGSNGTAREGQLFSVAYRSFESRHRPHKDEPYHYAYHRWSLRARIKLPDGLKVAPIGHLGGERRPVTFAEATLGDWWNCPEELKKQLPNARYLRLVLATPAIFDSWKPAWLTDESHQARIKGLAGMKLKLVAAAVGRREPVSGWNVRENKPKAVRWMVPAGSVYFFEVEANSEKIVENWLKPVSDNEQDRKDGFGLAMWGVWNRGN